MFLSSTDQSSPNNPSSSSNFLHLTNSSDELGQSHLSSFSIRDYAFSHRTKDIKKSWPFSSTSLQLCLKHGLTDPLPPIQLLGSVKTPTVHPPEASSLKTPNSTHVEATSYKRKLERLGSNHTLAETKQGFENAYLTSGSKSEIQVATVNKNPRKKCGLIVKTGACVDSGSKEGQSCHFAASESMALRTCPICKTFSSASNTTLNAHIDQCLSVDSGQQPISKPNKPRNKPRLKVKSITDIYAAAKRCTLEDLDIRNGTKWAVISSYSNRVASDDKPEVSNKGKKRSMLHVRIDEDDAGIGPVYIDAKGQKLRILSEFNEKASDPPREQEDVSEKKSSSEGKGNHKSFRKRLREKKYYKHCKVVPQSKKLTIRKGNASEIPEYQRGYSEDGRGMERSETPGTTQRRIFNQRMLTKRRLSRNENRIGRKSDQPSENEHSLLADPLMLRGPSHASTDLSETVSSPLKSQNSWRICGESLVTGKRSKSASFGANPLRCSRPVDKVFASETKGFMKLKKARLDFSENEDEDEEEDSGRWESEMTQERELADYDDWDDNEETDKVLLSSNPSFSGQDNDYESYEGTGNNKGEDDMLDRTNVAEAEFESMIYEKTGCETAERGSSFMEVDPIPIPGPPGSFLQSPWDMGIDAVENHGNSSVITSQVQSSQDQLDLTDRNSSESPVSAISNFAAPETQTLSLHNIITTDKRPSRFRDSDQSCCCQRKEIAFEDTTFGQPGTTHMIQQDLDLLSKSVPAVSSNSNPVLRLMGKDLMVINQREETSHGDSSLKPTSQFIDLSKTQQVSPPVHLLHRPYGGSGLYFDTSTSFYNIP
ncbi:hypothetical protein EUTSA_v10012702mg [Eutrema salsugineum]|uniref:UBZ4-type domain-containing protein n=1 Tax=Eutrema salsugineum TaxID=72664 RepID=V4NAF9_EUTSA|nr:uncharacterized protein LOC18016456 [Eutrema salsugineum]XP_006401359.1 uncharacterized protein LOC18016456 [Eutrema salsugineum]ESQ42810.1 hypothetical protein EUTSA_v10012702mg [Eutrema salsugineum]ESQ42811.1 hypothetical protein EUTSA_v10012702mg [Eutrema salsugineum]ESQ42812.1 hypothetical protein EUTSA_v10012702mg [Eutrema salsugineum]